MDRTATWVARVFGITLIVFLGAPVAILIVAGRAGVPVLFHDAEFRAALVTTAVTATVATTIGVLCGSPIAYMLARHRFRGRALLAAVIDIPLLIPHPVAGIAILLLLSRDTALGQLFMDAGLRVIGSPTGIVAAMLFVSVPLYISAAREAFAKVDPSYERVARTLGAGPWRVVRRITLPLAARGLTSAGVVMWSRAVSEFGAVVILAYNPKVVSVLSYDRFTIGGLPSALPVATVLVVLSFIPLTLLRALRYERETETAL
jgi:molybdate/tungstate transport system permease protein